MKAKRTHTTIRIKADQYDALLRIATAQQRKKRVPVTVGQLTRIAVEEYLERQKGK
jgi:hypothetical protein